MFHAQRRRRAAGQEGASAVEFAIVASLLFLLLFAIIEFGIFFAQDLALSNGARQGARAGAVPGGGGVPLGTCGVIYDEVQQGVVTIALNPDRVQIQVRRDSDPDSTNRCEPAAGSPETPNAPNDRPCEGAAAGDQLRVDATYQAQLAIPFFGIDDITLSREGLYRCEYSDIAPLPSPSASST